MVVFLATMMLCGCNRHNANSQVSDKEGGENEKVAGYGTGNVTQGSWLQLFMGMGFEERKDEDSPSRYECSVPELEDDDNVVRQELEAIWYHNDSDLPARYRCTFGLYVDKDFPSQEIFKQVELGIDTLLTQSFCYDDELKDIKELYAKRKGYAPRSTQDILNRAKTMFDVFTQKMQPSKPDSAYYDKYPESRVCIVAHKIYDQGDWATYIIEFSFDYNGSNGCPSWADYITVNKKTGRRFTTEDVVKDYGIKPLSKNLRKAFIKAKKERNADLEVQNYSGMELIEYADGCAIVNEGLMFYYRPYNIGCGAEGSYNLVLDMK